MQEAAHAVPNAVVHAGWRHRAGHWVGLGITTFEKRRLSGALFMTDWNFANFMYCHGHCNGRCSRDVYIYAHPPLPPWRMARTAVCQHWVYCKGELCIYISAWASTLLVQQYRAMRRPQSVGRVTRVPTLFLCRKNNTKQIFIGNHGDCLHVLNSKVIAWNWGT